MITTAVVSRVQSPENTRETPDKAEKTKLT